MLQTRNNMEASDSTGVQLGRWGVLAGSALAILVLTLVPSSTEDTPSVFACVFCGDRALADAVVNVILYAPLGIGLALVGVRGRHMLLLGTGLSASIEAVQVLLPGRDASLGDVIANSCGIAIGALIVYSSACWLRPSRFASNWYCLTASMLAVATFSLTGYLLTPSFPTGAYSVAWTPVEDARPRYGGTVERASIGDISLRPERIEEVDALRALLAEGARVEASIVAGPPPAKSTALVLVRDDLMRKIFALGADRHHFIVSYRTRTADFRLDQPDLRVDQPADLSAGDTLLIKTWSYPTGRCLQLGAEAECGLGFTVGSGWSLLFYAESFPHWLKGVLDFGWIAGSFLLVGFWTRTRLTAGAAAFVAGLGLVIVPLTSQLVVTPLTEWIGAGLGLAGGVALQRATRPANHSQSESPTP